MNGLLVTLQLHHSSLCTAPPALLRPPKSLQWKLVLHSSRSHTTPWSFAPLLGIWGQLE